MATERASSSFIPEKVWEEKVRGRRALWSELKLTWMGVARMFRGEPKPTVDPIVAERLRVAHMALDVAELLKYNDRRANRQILGEAQHLLDCAEPSQGGDDASATDVPF